MTTVSVVLALLMVRLDQELLIDDRLGSSAWLFGGGSEGARGVLSAIAGTMITVTGVVFSITIVALQLASSQFTPRVLRNFTGDRGNQVVLGVFIGTFTYSLLVLRSVRSASDDRVIFVPSASITLAIILAVISIGFLIYFVHHSARSIQAAVVIDRAANDTHRLIDQLFPADIGKPAEQQAPIRPPDEEPRRVPAERGGYLQAINADSLFELAERGAFTIRVEPYVGDFVFAGTTLASVWPLNRLDREAIEGRPEEKNGQASLDDKIRSAFALGFERTAQEDLGFGFRQLADIGVKALSPGINDPTTATMSINRMADALVTLAGRTPPAPVRTGEDGSVRLILSGPPFEDLVRLAFSQVRHYGVGDPSVAEHLGRTLGRVAMLVPDQLRPPLVIEARRLIEAALEKITVEGDRVRVLEACAWALTPNAEAVDPQ